MNIRQCRHIRQLQFKALSSIRHTSIQGASRAELDEITQLCPICTGVIVTMMQFLEADDVEAAKLRVLATLAVAK
jgi:hypothetical protein